jgi:Protein of unknown function (DUF3224)
MSEHVKTSMDVTSWDEQTISESGDTKVTRTTMGQSCSGDIEGTSASELVMYYQKGGTATIVGFLTIEGSIGDRKGTVVLRSIGAFDGSQATADLTVVDGSGTGGLAGISGSGSSVAPSGPTAFVELDLELPAQK